MNYEKLSSETQPENPKKNAGFFSLLTFAWLNDLLKQGNKRPLENDDLPPLLKEDQNEALVEHLQKEWILICDESKPGESKGWIKTAKLWGAFLRIVPVSEILVVVSLASLHVTLRIMQPLFLIGLLSELMEESRVLKRWIYFHAAGVCLCAWLIAISKCHCDYRSSMIAMRIRSAVLGLVYKKVLQLSLSDLTRMTTGHVINLISNDVQRFDRAVRGLPSLLLAPFGFLTANTILFHFIGWPTLFGNVYLLVIFVYQVHGSQLATQLRLKAVVLADKRVKVINEIIRGIRTIKICSWEKYFGRLVSLVRGKEISVIRKISVFQASIKSITATNARLTSLIIFLTYLVSGHSLTTLSVFVIFAYAKVLTIFTKYFGRRLSPFLDCNMSVLRIQKFLVTAQGSSLHTKKQLSKCSVSETKVVSKLKEPHNYSNPTVSLTNVRCKVKDKMLLENVNIKTDKPQIVAITGPVGSGKTSLLLAMLGELSIYNGNVDRTGKLAFVGQLPWVFSGTLRDNIIFNEPFDSTKFQKIVEICALKKDIERFPDEDLTTIGERGIVLSGGQRVRVSMARALYSDADIFLLDDPLSCVDAQVGNQIFEDYILTALRGRLCFFVTHQPCYIKYADHIIVMNKGSIAWEGSFTDLNKSDPHEIAGLGTIFTTDESLNNTTSSDSVFQEKRDFQSSEETSLVIPKEDRNFGSVSYKTYWKYFRAGIPVYQMVILLVISNSALASQVVPDWLMAQWNGITWASSSDRANIYLYVGLALGSTVLLFLSAFLFYQATINSSRNLHGKMLKAIVMAPVFFFDTNPSGRISNRFSKDIGVMDEMLFASFYDLYETIWGLLLSVGIPSLANLWALFAAVPLTGVATYYGLYCLKTSREIARLEAINRSPLYSHFSLTLEGIVNIRTYQQQDKFMDEYFCHQEKLTKTWFVSIAVARWLHFRMDCMTSFFLTIVTVVAVVTSQHAGLTGLAIIYCMDLLENLDFTVRESLEVENMMTSVERVFSYSNLESEPGYRDQNEPLKDWPGEGRIQTNNLRLVYYSGGPEALKDINISVAPAEKIGIAGRTGAGKSSFVAAVMRMPEPTGQVLIDGQNIQQLSLPSYRSKISVIPQDPVLFSGPLRFNLDPGSEFQDAQIWNALEAVQLKSLVQKQDNKLHYEISEGGSNFSVGEKQLLCLARALLQENRIIILDEATANVDFATDKLIQETIRTKFKNCTVITIAHRVDTILDYDRILVVDGGKVVEFDTPEWLLRNEAGKFAELYRLQHPAT